MRRLAERFCREAQQREGLRYSSRLKRLAVEYAVAAEHGGAGQLEIAETLGLSKATLYRWRSGPLAAEMREVRVVAERGGGPILVMPSGARVEGLTLEDLARLLAAIG